MRLDKAEDRDGNLIWAEQLETMKHVAQSNMEVFMIEFLIGMLVDWFLFV